MSFLYISWIKDINHISPSLLPRPPPCSKSRLTGDHSQKSPSASALPSWCHLLSKTSFLGQPIWCPSLLYYRLLSSARVKLVSAGIAATTSPLFSTSFQYYSISQVSFLPYSPTAVQMFSPPLFSNPTTPFFLFQEKTLSSNSLRNQVHPSGSLSFPRCAPTNLSAPTS